MNTNNIPLVLIKISPTLGRGIWKSSILRGLPGSQKTAARMLEGPFPKWYPLASVDRNRPRDAGPTDKRHNSLRKAGTKREKTAMREICAGPPIDQQQESFAFEERLVCLFVLSWSVSLTRNR